MLSGSVRAPVVVASFSDCDRNCSYRLRTDVFLTALEPWHNVTARVAQEAQCSARGMGTRL